MFIHFLFFFFFFSSRRRHTRCGRDWSSDVCSSDLLQAGFCSATKAGLQLLEWLGRLDDSKLRTLAVNITTAAMKQALGEESFKDRSEERRVGKECRKQEARDNEKKKIKEIISEDII